MAAPRVRANIVRLGGVNPMFLNDARDTKGKSIALIEIPDKNSVMTFNVDFSLGDALYAAKNDGVKGWPPFIPVLLDL